MREFAKTFYSSKAWQRCRAAYAESKGNLCERCLAKGLIVPGEIVHHKIHLTEKNVSDPMVALNWDNLALLCRECHAQEHGEETYGKKQKRYIVGDNGEVVGI